MEAPSLAPALNLLSHDAQVAARASGRGRSDRSTDALASQRRPCRRLHSRYVERIDFDNLDATGFEEFCFELLRELPGFSNVDWRKGTGLGASPADRGRDMLAEVTRRDVDGTQHTETWFVDCKHYRRGVPPEAIQGLLAWAHAERPHVALIIASNFLSNPTKDYLRDYENNNRPPFRIKHWERPVVERLARGNRDLLARFLLTGHRSESEIIAAEQEFFDRVWYERHLVFRHKYEAGEKGRSCMFRGWGDGRVAR